MSLKLRLQFFNAVFFSPLLFQPPKSRIFGLSLLGSLQRNELAISIPVAPARGSWPSPSQSSLRRGWEAAGLGGVGLGPRPGVNNCSYHFALQYIDPFKFDFRQCHGVEVGSMVSVTTAGRE